MSKKENKILNEACVQEVEKMYEIEYFEISGWTMKKVYDKETMLKEVEKMLNSHLVKEYRVSVLDEENNRELIHYRKKTRWAE